MKMPYDSVKDLPKSVKKLPVSAQKLFVKVFNKTYKNKSEEVAFKIAWSAVKKKFKKKNGSWVAKGEGFTLFTFEMNNNSDVFVKKSDDGEYYLEGVLSDVGVDTQGNRFTEETLKDYAEQINKHGIGGFITHKDWKEFCLNNSHLPEEAFVAKAREERKGIIKTVKAIYDKGKLWIKGLIDKRYLKRIKGFKKMSIEAVVPKRYQKNNNYYGGYVLGFALANDAANPRTNATISG